MAISKSGNKRASAPFVSFMASLATLRPRKIISGLYTWLAHLGCSSACALLFRQRMVLVQKSSAPKYTIIVMEKGGLGLDVISSLPAREGYEIYYANRTDLQSICRAFFSEEINDSNYITSRGEFDEEKGRYRAFLDKMWVAMTKSFPVDMVLSANVVYYAERELSAMLKEKNVPHVVIHKECLKSPKMVELVLEEYRDKVGKLDAYHVMVYNRIERDLQVGAGMVHPERISVVGMPRLDRFHRWREEGHRPILKADVLVMFFGYRAGIRNTGDSETLRRGWVDLCQQSYAAILRLARDNPEIRINIKAKGFSGGGKGLARFMFRDAEVPKNIGFIMGEDPFDHITACKVVCGFNTTGLLEAIAAGIPVVVPQFGEISLPDIGQAVVNLGDVADYADTPDELSRKLAYYARMEPARNARLGDEQKQELDKWVGNSDGLSGQRVKKTILAILNK